MPRSRRILAIFFALLGFVLLGSLSDSQLKTVEPTPGLLPRVPRFVIKRPARVDVVITDEARRPLSGGSVQVFSLLDERAYLGGAGRTDASGRATIASLPAAETWILAEAEGFARASTHLVLGEGARDVRLVLVREERLRMAVFDDGGAPIAGASIEVQTGDPVPLAADTDAKGEGTVGRLGPPPWDVRISAVGYESARSSIKAASAPGVDPVRMTLRRLGAVEVMAVDPEGQPLGRATVMAVGSGLWPARKIATDASGHALVSDLPRGMYDFRAVWGDLVSPVEVGVALGRGEVKSFKLTLAPGRRVAVRVTDGEGSDARPLSGASLVLAEGGVSSFPLEAKADAQGEATLGPITPGAAYVSAQALGFVARSGVAVPDGAAPVVSITLVRGAVLSGEVVDTRGFPVRGATIEVIGTSASGEPIFESSERIAFRATHFSRLLGASEAAAGRAELGTDRRGMSPLLAGETAPRDRPPVGELGVTLGPVPPIPRSAAPFAATVAGPSAAGLLAATTPAGPGVAVPPPAAEPLPEPWVTASDGKFRASPLPAGQARAIVRHPAYVEATSEPFTLTSASETHVRVVLRAGATLEGRLLDDRRMPVYHARIQLVSSEASLERSTSSARDGTFAFAAVPPEVALSISLPGEAGEVALRLPLSLEEGQRKELELVLPPAREPVVVRVTSDRGNPLEGAEVLLLSLSSESPQRRTLFTDREGQAAFPHAFGLPVRLSITHRGHAPVVQQLDAAPAEVAVAVGTGIAVTGAVTALRGRERLDGAEVTLYAAAGPIRARTDRDGLYRFDDVPPGMARLVAARKGYVKAEQSVSIESPAHADRAVSLDPLDLEPGGSVEGEVVDAHGEPVAGARVTAGSVPAVAPAGGPPEAVTTTDPRGHFRLDGIVEGEVALEAWAAEPGRGRARGVRVIAGETTSGIRIELARE